MRRTLVPALILVLGLGCSDIIPPTREAAYEFRGSSGGLEIAFHWPREQMPVTIYVDPASPLYQHTLTAISRWQDALLYGEFRGIVVSDSTGADLVLHNIPPDLSPSGMVRASMAPQCSGETQLDVDLTTRTMHLPVQIYIWVNGSPSTEALTTCYRLTTTHEIGHALGIFQHSPNRTDVMYRDPVVDGLSDADRQTMELVFHTIPTITIVRDQQP